MTSRSYYPTGSDDLPSLQALVSQMRTGRLYLPGGLYRLSGPPDFTGTVDLTVQGDGRSCTVLGAMGAYAGPLALAGLTPADTSAAFRPLCAAGDFDSSVTGKRFAVATLGKQSLSVTGHPLQHGPFVPGAGPNYYGGPGVLTIDIYYSGDPQIGISNSVDDPPSKPAPFNALDWNGGFSLFLGLADGRRAPVTVPGVRGGKLSLQYDTVTGRVAAWLAGADGIGHAVPVAPAWPNLWSPPFGLRRSDGLAPFGVGAPFARAPVPGKVANLTVKGLRVAFGAPRYAWDSGTQVTTTGRTVNDSLRFFDQTEPSLCGVLPLDDAPGKGWVNVVSPAKLGVLLWTPPPRWSTTSNLCFKDLSFASQGQPALLIGSVMGLRLDNVGAGGGAIGVGSLPTGYSYPVSCERFDFRGYHAGAVLYGCTVDCSLKSGSVTPGRFGLQLDTVLCSIEGVTVQPPPAWGESPIDFAVGDDGGRIVSHGLIVDDEPPGGVYSGPIVAARQGAVAGGRLEFHDLSVAALGDGRPVFGLSGDPGYPNHCEIVAEHTQVWSGDPKLCEVTGGGWTGQVDGQVVGGPGPGPAPAPPVVAPPSGQLPPNRQ